MCHYNMGVQRIPSKEGRHSLESSPPLMTSPMVRPRGLGLSRGSCAHDLWTPLHCFPLPAPITRAPCGQKLDCPLTKFPVLLKEWALKSARTTIRFWLSCLLWFESELSPQAQALNTWPPVGSTVLGGDGNQKRWQALGTTDAALRGQCCCGSTDPKSPFPR